jgi:hypothetical protein
MGVPGNFISADEQCRFYHKGKDGAAAANKPKDENICQSLLCTDGEAIEVGMEHIGARREDVFLCSPHGGVAGGKECASLDVWSTALDIRR